MKVEGRGWSNDVRVNESFRMVPVRLKTVRLAPRNSIASEKRAKFPFWASSCALVTKEFPRKTSKFEGKHNENVTMLWEKKRAFEWCMSHWKRSSWHWETLMQVNYENASTNMAQKGNFVRFLVIHLHPNFSVPIAPFSTGPEPLECSHSRAHHPPFLFLQPSLFVLII